MFNLFVSYFKSKSKYRQKELDTCLLNNLSLNTINRVYVLTEEPIDIPINNKAIPILIKSRPSYNNLFDIINNLTDSNDWNIIANSDIYFDDSLEKVNQYSHKKKVCFALCRWEVLVNKIEFLNRRDSQDCWIFKGHVSGVNGDFNLGVAGCDNAIADRFYRGGYEVINPSRTIKTYHLHQSQERTYDVNVKVPQPYKLLAPTT